jgi:hypothetical protein
MKIPHLNVLGSCDAGWFISFPFPLDITVKNISPMDVVK